MSHYDYFELHFGKFLEDLGLKRDQAYGLAVAHGDKGYSYRLKWEDAGISFNHGMMIYLLSYISPFSKEVRTTQNGWVDVSDWVIVNYPNFKSLLP